VAPKQWPWPPHHLQAEASNKHGQMIMLHVTVCNATSTVVGGGACSSHIALQCWGQPAPVIWCFLQVYATPLHSSEVQQRVPEACKPA
jgi:hypothetical protein